MAEVKEVIKGQIKDLEGQMKNAETLYMKIQGAIEALNQTLKALDTPEEKKSKK